jgi:hypothetical protein
MAYRLVHRFAGGTREQYEATIAVVHPNGGLPDGQVFMQPARRPTAGRSWRSMTRREAGSGSATEP